MNPAIEILLKSKRELTTQRDHEYSLATSAILKVDAAIEVLSGKKVWEIEKEILYDDESPNYIIGSEDGI